MCLKAFFDLDNKHFVDYAVDYEADKNDDRIHGGIMMSSEKIDFQSPEYKRSRAAYMTQCTVYYFVTLLVTDAFLAKLLGSIGIRDSLIGIISSFISVSFVIQLLAIFIVRLKVSTKKLVILFDTVGIFFFMLLYLIPFMPISTQFKTALVIISIVAAYAGNYLISSICYKWANSFVEPTKRASYSATKEMISLVSGMVFTAAAGFVIDRFEGLGNLNGAFLFIAVSLLVLNVCNISCYLMIGKERESDKAEEDISILAVLKAVMTNKDFRNLVILTILWNMAMYFTVGFMGTFKTNDLMMSVFSVQVINIAANFARMLISKPMGRYSDKHSYAKGFKLGLYMAAVAFFINMFTTRSTWFLVVLYSILYSCCFAGTNQNSYNMTYSYVESKYITQAMAIKNSIGGICGFAASVLAGKILGHIQENDNQIFGMRIYAQQLLSAVSFVLVVIAIIFIKKVIEKQKVMIQ